MWYGLRGLKGNFATSGEMLENVEKCLEEVGLEKKSNTRAKDLSGGQKRKLQVALSFVGNPEVIYLDEPTAGMDTSARREIWDLLQVSGVSLTTTSDDKLN